MLHLKFFKIDLDIYSEIKVFIICNYISIKLIYYRFINNIMISCLKFKLMNKNFFKLAAL